MEWEDREAEPAKKKSDGPGNKIKTHVCGGDMGACFWPRWHVMEGCQEAVIKSWSWTMTQ